MDIPHALHVDDFTFEYFVKRLIPDMDEKRVFLTGQVYLKLNRTRLECLTFSTIAIKCNRNCNSGVSGMALNYNSAPVTQACYRLV